MSQFQTNPNIVRIVFTYANENTPNGNFNCIANDKGIVIRYSNSLNKTSNYQIIYSNTNDEDRTVFSKIQQHQLQPRYNSAGK